MIYTLTKLARRIRKSPQNGRFLEERHTKNLQYCVETHIQVEPLLDDRHQDVCTYGGPDLRLQRVGAGADERLDAQVLLDSLEEQLDVPAAAGRAWQDIRSRFKSISPVLARKRLRYRSAIVFAGSTKLLVKKTSLFSLSGSRNRTRRRRSGYPFTE